MEITIKEARTSVPVTIMQLHGELDASNYLDVIERAKEIYAAGTRNLLLDLSELSFMSSSGLVALHGIAMTMQGRPLPDTEQGWATFHSIERDVETGFVGNCKIFNPQSSVSRLLEVTGFNKFLEIYTDLDQALAYFECYASENLPL
jgi:anti-anti-sigma regulatory factor